MAACWARKGGRAAWLDSKVDWTCWVSVWESAFRIASFCGLGGMGGGVTLGAGVGRVVSKGEVRRSSGGLALGNCCCWRG